MAFKHASGGHYMLGKPKGDVNLNLINWLQQEVLSESVSNLWRRKKAGVSLVDKLMVLTLNLYLKFDSMLDGEGNGNPLQYSCLENPMDGGAWWAAIHGVAKSRTHWATSLSLFTFMHWRRKWHPTPVFLPGESQGRGSLVGCRRWGRTEQDMTEAT